MVGDNDGGNQGGDDAVDPVVPNPPDGGDQCSGVPIAIPNSCSQYDCATV
jgi:hypothetical protein